jgi:hypothetical protein
LQTRNTVAVVPDCHTRISLFPAANNMQKSNQIFIVFHTDQIHVRYRSA